jgi:HK97 gp10 family phage protein
MAESKILGIGELQGKFRSLGPDMATRGSRVMVVAGGTVLKNKAKANARGRGLVKTGAMVKNIVIKREPNAPSGTTQYNLGVRHGRNLTKKQKSTSKLTVGRGGRIVKKYTDDPFYWRFQEFEHKVTPRSGGADGETTYTTTLKNGKVVTRKRKFSGQGMRARRRAATTVVPAKPFIQPALTEGAADAINAMQSALDKLIAKAATK